MDTVYGDQLDERLQSYGTDNIFIIIVVITILVAFIYIIRRKFLSNGNRIYYRPQSQNASPSGSTVLHDVHTIENQLPPVPTFLATAEENVQTDNEIEDDNCKTPLGTFSYFK